jgi:hypothetical protein
VQGADNRDRGRPGKIDQNSIRLDSLTDVDERVILAREEATAVQTAFGVEEAVLHVDDKDGAAARELVIWTSVSAVIRHWEPRN